MAERFYAQSISVNFSVTTIVGPGFIALAAMIFGKWNPIGAMLSSLFFGLSQSLAVIGSQLPFLQGVPAVYLQIAPYVLTILVLAAFFGKAVAPKADGINYIKSNKHTKNVSSMNELTFYFFGYW